MSHPRTIRVVLFTTTFMALAALSACDKASERTELTPLSSPMSLGTQVDDAAITASVKAALVADDLVKSLDVQVETRKGVVQLSGYVDSQAQISQIAALTRSVAGVREIENGITLKGAPGSVGTAIDDTTITGRVKAALLSAPGIKSFDIGVLTHQGEVQLTGFVNSQAQIDQANKLAAGAEGVRSVKNELMIKE